MGRWTLILEYSIKMAFCLLLVHVSGISTMPVIAMSAQITGKMYRAKVGLYLVISVIANYSDHKCKQKNLKLSPSADPKQLLLFSMTNNERGTQSGHTDHH